MRTRHVLAAATAATALVLSVATPAGAGDTAAQIELDPNPATVGATVTITPMIGCPDFEAGQPTVQIDITGPENDSFQEGTTYDDGSGRYEWSADMTAGPVGVYTVQATCEYPGGPAATGRQELPTYAYAPATLQVIEPDPTTTTTSTTSVPESTTSTTAPAAAAAPVTARPAYTG